MSSGVINKIPICDQIIQEDQNEPGEQTRNIKGNENNISPDSIIDMQDNSLNFTR
jgi:hypothetical protein